MTSDVERLHAELDARKRQLGMPWWQVAVQADLSEDALHRLRYGVASARTRQAVEAWLHRHTASPKTSHETKQGGTEHDSSGNG